MDVMEMSQACYVSIKSGYHLEGRAIRSICPRNAHYGDAL
jgi:hypothetical protein